MPNKLITPDEMVRGVMECAEKACAEAGVSVDEFWAAIAEAWNEAIARDEADEMEFA